jgi:hypothetical protein
VVQGLEGAADLRTTTTAEPSPLVGASATAAGVGFDVAAVPTEAGWEARLMMVLQWPGVFWVF